MERLSSSENSCLVEELETLLIDSGHLRALAFLYASKGISSKALSIWRSLARNYSSGGYKKDQSSEIDRREDAATEASKILEHSSDQDLILQHLGWIADVNQTLAINVLISDGRPEFLSPGEISIEILLRYLQWLIEDRESDEARFHTAYALLLAKSVLESYETGISQNPVRERFQMFLGSSDAYDAEEVLYTIEESELWLEKAILYRRLGQESLVLEILALKLEDFEAAEQYCTEIGRPDAYNQLFEMYLDPKDGREAMVTAAIKLLHRHGQMLNPLQVLERLSSEMPLRLASDTIVKILRARTHHHHQGQ
ncbi:hypothetical protein M569_03687, partial [Genlisea aurea]